MLIALANFKEHAWSLIVICLFEAVPNTMFIRDLSAHVLLLILLVFF